MPNLPKAALSVLAALALAGCAGHRVHEEEPHHYSKDARGNRIACYTTDVVNEYECVPVARSRHAYDPYWHDPFWPHISLGFWYGWPRYYGGVTYYPYPWYPPHHRWHRRHRH